jgi:hypothetical protein
MQNSMLYWDIYQVNSKTENLIGVKFRGTIRKFAIENGLVLLVENATDEENAVRFALLPHKTEVDTLNNILIFIHSIVKDANIQKVLSNTPNPILSKLKNNDLSRY